MSVQPYGSYGAIPPSPYQFQTGAIAIPPPYGTVPSYPAGGSLGNPNDPIAWVTMLQNKLYWQAQHAAFYDSYYSGDRANLLARKLFADVFSDGSAIPHLLPPEANLGKIGIDAKAERLRIQGFRVGDDPAQAGGKEAWNIWLGNDLDVMWPVAQTESFVKGLSVLLVWPGVDGEPVISVEDATQTVLHRQNVPPYAVDAGLKVFIDEWTGLHVGYLWRPGVRYTLAAGVGGSGWQVTGKVASPAAVPLYELSNRTRLMRAPSSELAGVTPLLDVYTLLMADLVVAADTGAFPIRTATGIKLTRDAQGRAQTPFDVRVDKAMVSENPEARFGSLPPSDLAGYIAAISMVLQQVRMLTRAPEHYYGQGANSNVSGEALKSSESPLVWSVESVQGPFGSTARRTMGQSLTVAGSAYAGQLVTTTWARTETRVEAQDVDAGQKLEAMGVPLDLILTETIGYPPELVARAMNGVAQRTKDAQALIQAIQHDALENPAAAAGAAALFRGSPGGALGEVT